MQPIPGLRIRDKSERAARLASARAWRVQTKPYFDAIYGPEPDPAELAAQRIANARAWHIRMKPHFDALYGSHRCTGPICMGEH